MGEWLTDNGVEITPGLRVFTNEWKWGTVEEAQFTEGGSTRPGGKYFDGWFYVRQDDGSRKVFNGERMTTSEMHKPDPQRKR